MREREVCRARMAAWLEAVRGFCRYSTKRFTSVPFHHDSAHSDSASALSLSVLGCVSLRALDMYRGNTRAACAAVDRFGLLQARRERTLHCTLVTTTASLGDTIRLCAAFLTKSIHRFLAVQLCLRFHEDLLDGTVCLSMEAGEVDQLLLGCAMGCARTKQNNPVCWDLAAFLRSFTVDRGQHPW